MAYYVRKTADGAEVRDSVGDTDSGRLVRSFHRPFAWLRAWIWVLRG